jgi:predicted AAA+ superfamily ATPase
MIVRRRHLQELRELSAQFPVVALLGPRQVGKSTLARAFRGSKAKATNYFDLESPRDLARLQNPELVLEPLRGLIVIDEVQRRPDLFPVLRVLADRPARPARFLVLGSASPELLRQGSETLAGRIVYHELGGFDLGEVTSRHLDALWLRGGFPRSYTAKTEAQSARWRREFIKTFAERELAELQLGIAPAVLGRFWTMLAHYHGQIWNGAELARAFGVSEKTVRRYLDILEGTFMVRRLAPWHENLAKRQIKAPKIYLRDSGLLHSLLGIETRDDLLGHPKSGASWEGFVVGEVTRHLGAEPRDCYFWGLHSGAELDLLVVRGKSRLGFEIKLTDAPRVTPSMRNAERDLRLEHLYVIHAGPSSFPLTDRITAVPLAHLEEGLRA